MLWVGVGGAVPSNLVAALDRRGMEVLILREPAEVMVELAEAAKHNTLATDDDPRPVGEQRDAEPAQGWGGSLIMVEPRQQPQAAELCAAVRAYHPAVRCWKYEAHGSGGGPLLAAMSHETDAAFDVDEFEPAQQSFIEDKTDSVADTYAEGEVEHASPEPDAESAGDADDAPPPLTLHLPDAAPVGMAGGEEGEGESLIAGGSRHRLAALALRVEAPARVAPQRLVSEEELAMLLGAEERTS